MIELLAVMVVVLAVVAMVLGALLLRGSRVVTLAPFAAPEVVDDGALRHRHRFGQKDADSIRHCRCGDRYLDGMVV